MAFIKQPFSRKTNQSNESGYVDGGQTQESNTQAPTSNWVNLNQLISGNQGTGKQMAADLTKGVNSQASKAVEDAGAWETKAAGEVSKGIKEDYSKKFNTMDFSKMSEADKAGYQTWKAKSGYSGPADASKAQGYNGVFKGIADANEKVGQAGDFNGGGQQVLAKETLAKNNANYGAGMGMLDTILMRQAGGAQALDKTQADYGAVKDSDGQDSTKLNQNFKTMTNSVADKIKSTRELGEGRNALAQTALNARVNQLAQDNAMDVIKENYANVDENRAAVAEAKKKMKDAGIPQDVINARIGDMVRQASTSLTRGDVMSNEQRTALTNMTGLGGIGDAKTIEEMQRAGSNAVFDPRIDDAAIQSLIDETQARRQAEAQAAEEAARQVKVAEGQARDARDTTANAENQQDQAAFDEMNNQPYDPNDPGGQYETGYRAEQGNEEGSYTGQEVGKGLKKVGNEVRKTWKRWNS